MIQKNNMDIENIPLRYYWEDNIYNLDVLLNFYFSNEKISFNTEELHQQIKDNFQNKIKKIAVAANGNIVVGLAITNLENKIEMFSIINLFKNKEKEKEFKNWINQK